MYLEERISRLEEENASLKKRLEALERKGADRFLNAHEVADMFGCAPNTIYTKIRSGEIYATRKAGGVKIPLSQFYEPEKVVKLPDRQKKENLSLKEQVFG